MSACKKARYRDEIQARFVLATIQRRDGSGRAKIEQRAYRCRECRAWHLTSRRAGGAA
jgi:hypothetical protein